MGRRSSEWRQRREEVSSSVDRLLALAASQPRQPPGASAPKEDPWEQHLRMRQLVERISSLEANTGTSSEVSDASDPSKRLQNIAQFKKWLVDNGVDISGVEIVEFPEYGLGLKATKPFTKGQNIMNIPRKIIMTEDCAKQSNLGSFISKNPILKLMPNISLVIFLILMKHTKNSFWKPYIDILPTTYNTIFYFSSNDMLELKGSANFKPALKLWQDIARQYAYFFKQLHHSSESVADSLKKVFTYKEYCWAVSTVMTRLNMVPSEANPETQTTALIPLWDMCNHTNGEITTYFNVENNQAECFSLNDYDVGDQILIYYGIRSNAFFFLNNGFVYPENNNDTLTLTFGISKNDPLHLRKLQLLEKLEIYWVFDFKYQISNQEIPITPGLLGFSRVFVMDKDALDFWHEAENFKDLLQIDCPSMQPEIEKKAFNFLHTRCQLLLNTYNMKNCNTKMTDLSITENGNDNTKLNKSDNHKILVRKLKETEVKLLEKAIAFTQKRL